LKTFFESWKRDEFGICPKHRTAHCFHDTHSSHA
jgi:hypothetical protein